MPLGINFVEKWAPFTPEADAAAIASVGLNTVRLGVSFDVGWEHGSGPGCQMSGCSSTGATGRSVNA